MARNKATLQNIDKSSPANYPNGRIKDNTGSGDGTPVNEFVYGDIHEFFAKLMREGGLTYNDLPDNESQGYQLVEALKAFANKNSYVYPITSVGGMLNIPLKLGILKENETLICKASVNKNSETRIKGTIDNNTKDVIYVGDFKADEYVRLINTGPRIILVRVFDWTNINEVVQAFDFLKAATYAQEKNGTLDTVATNPKTNALVFVERVNGAESSNSLAIAGTRNGLLSKEDKEKIDNLGDPNVKNVGFFSGYNVAVVSDNNKNYPTGGNIIQATKISQIDKMDRIRVFFENPMPDTDYFLRMSVQSQGTEPRSDNDISQILWKPTSINYAELYIEETNSSTQNLKIFIEAVLL